MKRKMSMDEFLSRYWPRVPDVVVDAAGERVWKRLGAELEKHDTSLWSLSSDGWSVPPLKQREFQVLTAVSLLGDRSDIHAITDMVEDWTGGTMIGKVYATLQGLEKRGLIKFHRSRKAEDRGEPTHQYEVTAQGGRALRRAGIEGKELTNAPEDSWLKRMLRSGERP